MAQLGFSPAIDVWLLPVAQGGTQKPVTASTLWADKQMFTFDQAQSMRVLALSGQGVVVDIFSIHNRSDRMLACSRKESPAMRGFSFSAIASELCLAALIFVHRDLQTGNLLPYGAIDCIAVNRCV